MPSLGGRCTEQMKTIAQSLLHAFLMAFLPISQNVHPHSLSFGGAEKLELMCNLEFFTSVRAQTPRLGSQELATK